MRVYVTMNPIRSNRLAFIRAFVFFSAAALCAAPAGVEIKPGDTEQDVINAFDARPKGRLVKGNMTVLFYDLGTVTLIDGRVQSFNLVSGEEARNAARPSADAAERRVAAEQARKKRPEAGMLEKSKKTEDPEFRRLSARERLEYWLEFSRTYPETPVDAEIAEAHRELPAEQQRAALGERVESPAEKKAEIEARIAKLQNIRGLSRTGLISARRELAALKSQLAALQNADSKADLPVKK